tara:strand:- start:247 stop:1122 length:876 start_codon:yes stop_codon:yes gene_type:complete
MFFDFIWGKGTKITNFLQKNSLISDEFRNLLRSFAHFFIKDPEERIIELNYGFLMLTPAGHKGSRSYKNGTYEDALFNFVQKHTHKEEIIIDIGAALGYYTLMFSKAVGKSGKVYSFEPEKNAYSYLKKNISINNIQNVETFNLAVDDKDGEASFLKTSNFQNNKSNWGGSISRIESDLKVKTCSIDNLNLQNVDWIKLDVDGNEFRILKGMNQLIEKSNNIKLIMEFDSDIIKKNNTKLDINKTYEYLASAFEFALVCEENYKYLDLNKKDILKNIKGHKNLIFFKNKNI